MEVNFHSLVVTGAFLPQALGLFHPPTDSERTPTMCWDSVCAATMCGDSCDEQDVFSASWHLFSGGEVDRL